MLLFLCYDTITDKGAIIMRLSISDQDVSVDIEGAIISRALSGYFAYFRSHIRYSSTGYQACIRHLCSFYKGYGFDNCFRGINSIAGFNEDGSAMYGDLLDYNMFGDSVSKGTIPISSYGLSAYCCCNFLIFGDCRGYFVGIDGTKRKKRTFDQLVWDCKVLDSYIGVRAKVIEICNEYGLILPLKCFLNDDGKIVIDWLLDYGDFVLGGVERKFGIFFNDVCKVVTRDDCLHGGSIYRLELDDVEGLRGLLLMVKEV